MHSTRWESLRRFVIVIPLILGLLPTGMADAASPRKARAPHAAPATAHQKPAVAKPARRADRQALPLIVIDPGHGGRDAGAVGLSGTREKDVTLATARELERQIKATGRYRVVLTRGADLGVALAQRVAYARKSRAALFISIHADASADRSAHGASVYTGARTPNGSKVTEFVASPRNSGAIAEALSGGARQLSPGSAWLQYRLIDNLNDDIGMLREPARQAHLYVLTTLGIPSALLEMGFLSNREDEKLLKQAKHRAMIARAIRDAIDDYFNDPTHPGAART
jgi:N-acetylmuramoyl-L-alanine amidase